MGDIFVRKEKPDKPVVAICYDFDKTLSPDDMQAQGYIQSVGQNTVDFWNESNKMAKDNDMDQNLAYMYKMIVKAHGKFVFNKKALRDYGANVELFEGVDSWFERIREYGESRGVIVEHYIISSGLKEMIEGTKVAKAGAFEKIYASSFYYDEDGVAKWPAQVINYTNKTQFLFRIEKGVLDINDSGVNDYFAPEDIRIPFRNIIYIGDSDTDIPCMKLVNSYGGHAIGVFNSRTNDKTKVYKMMYENRIRYFAPANYSEGSKLDALVKTIIDRTVANEKLENIHYSDKEEYSKESSYQTAKEYEKLSKIMSLEESSSFAATHTIIRELRKVKEWSDNEIDELCQIAINNNQVSAIIEDSDIKNFYKKILKIVKQPTDAISQVAHMVDFDVKIYMPNHK